MNYNPNNGEPTRPQNGQASANAARGKKISVLSAILTGRRSRSIACVAVALVIALSAVATVTASIVASHRAEDASYAGQSLKADDAVAKDAVTDAAAPADAAPETETAADKSGAAVGDGASTGSTADSGESDGAETADAAADTDGAKAAEPEETDAEPDPSVHTVTIKFATRDDMVVTTRALTLRDFFACNNTGLSSAQLANVDLDTRIDSDVTISVDRVTYDTITEDEAIPYDTEYRDSADLDPGEKWVYRDGKYGVRTTKYDVKYLNGSEVYREEKSSWVSSDPVNKVVYVGVERSGSATASTRSYGSSGSSGSSGSAKNGLPALTVYEDGYITGADGVTRHYYGYIDVKATCYRAGGSTAYGLPADEHVIGVGRYDGTLTPIIPFGTKCYVVGPYGDFGERIASDYGNMFGYKIDICLYPTNPYYSNFGWRDMRVYLID